MSDTTQPRANNPTKPDLSFLAPPDVPGQVGKLGTYQVIKLLGYGGMGLVLHAHDPRLQRDVALKVMNAKFAADPTSRQRFLREARATAAVKHDHIVTIYEVGEANGVPFIAMERLLGLNLERYLKQLGKPMGVGHVQRIAREAAAGLQAAHDKGLVHRDIKLSNIFLEKEGGRVKLVDFGLAILPDSDHRVSSTGVIVGTPEFMSPEQARGEVVDHRSDLFSLGVVLYRLATGVQPFRGPTAIAVIMAISTDTPPPAISLNPAVPRGLSDLIDRLLAKHPKDRPQQAREVIAALSGTTSSPSLPAAAAPRSAPPLPVPDLWNFTPAVLPDGSAPPAPPLTNQYTPSPSQYPTTFPTPFPSASTNAYTVPTVVVPPPPPVAAPTPVPPPPPPPPVGSAWDELEDERPSRRSDRPSRRDEEDDRPSRRRATDDEDDRPSRRRDRDDDDDDDAPPKATGSKGAATASMVLGIIACVFLLFSCCGGQYVSTLLSITGLICAFVGLKGSKQRTAGFVLNSLALVPAVLAIFWASAALAMFGMRAGNAVNAVNDIRQEAGNGGGNFNGGGTNNGGGNFNSGGGGEKPPAVENGTVEFSVTNFDEIKDDPLELFFDGELDTQFPSHVYIWHDKKKYTRTLPVGEHAFEIKIAGQSAHTSKFTVKPPSQGVTYLTVKDLERPNATGTLEVKFTGKTKFLHTKEGDQEWPVNLETRIDGKLTDWRLNYYRETYDLPLAPGKHTIKLTKNGVDCFEKEVEVKKAKDGKTFLSLDRNDLFQQTVTITNTNPARVGQEIHVLVNDLFVNEYPVGARAHSFLVLVGQNKIEVVQKKPKELVFAKWTVDVTKEKPVKLEIK